jgi:urease accessory protein
MLTRSLTIAAALLLIAEPSLAHHPMGGATPTTFWQGLLSGFGHPILGLDHLAAVLAVGCLAATQRKCALLVAGYVLASLVGAWAHIGEATIPNAEIFVALSVVSLGLMLFRKDPLRQDIALALFAGAGLLNGYALGEAVAGASLAPLAAYFMGLALIQSALGFAAVYGTRMLLTRGAVHLLAVRVIGAFAVGAGAAIILQRYVTGA